MVFNTNNKDKNQENKIINIDQIDIITNGTIEELATLTNPNQIGNIVNPQGESISEITPLIMIINQASNLQEKLDILIKNGADIDKEINYYGSKSSARYLLNTYRTNITF